MSTRPDPTELLDLAVRIAREAGTLIDDRPTDLETRTKSSPTDPVTVMDRAAEALIVRRLDENRPDDAILGEEGASRDGSSGVRWIIDPIDGTVNYLYDIPAYAVSIGVEVDGEIVAGAVYSAWNHRVYQAIRGGGARLDDAPLRCSQVTDLRQSLVGTGFAYSADVRTRQGRIVAGLLPKVRDIRRIGSAALDLCHVAGGQLDAYYERGLKPWDRAAGTLIAQESGARVVALRDGDAEVTVAAAPGIADALATALRDRTAEPAPTGRH